MSSLATGGLLILLAAVMNASFTLPMKRMPHWQWENIWLVWSGTALIALPFLAAIYTVPHLFAGYKTVDPATLLRVVLFGAAWGVAQVLFGLSVSAIGIALTFSLVLGISAAVGTVVPFVRLHPDLLLTRIGLYVWCGVAVVSLGMVLCAIAGRLREKEAGQLVAGSTTPSFARGLLLACISGLCASFMNLGISFASPLIAMAAAHGSQPYWQLNAVWLPLLIGGAVPNILYCIFLLQRRSTARKFAETSTSSYWLLCVLMAILWFGSSLLFGMANFYLGSLGPVLGWPIFMSLIVILASLLGWVTGEWRTTSARPFRFQIAGITLLTLAVFLFARAGS
ncbi:L-rhamnose/proton symporter RhaT [Granulicella arctica]|uniref:L-rhamnose/proton symporter RhaT n=1 Tax=Granulicella arctica TaxID=940613 RepID=UPI0021E0C280|nr:L-rhamnose/proton symporter RhaT [Granulicella arctica]